MTAEECRIWRQRIGALVLGQLEPDERAATEAHLDGCPACREEHESLRALVGGEQAL
jgi:anti-sigma factor RsiW